MIDPSSIIAIFILDVGSLKRGGGSINLEQFVELMYRESHARQWHGEIGGHKP